VERASRAHLSISAAAVGVKEAPEVRSVPTLMELLNSGSGLEADVVVQEQALFTRPESDHDLDEADRICQTG